MKIVQLVAENFKKIKAVTIKPDSNIVLVTGANEQGKTSILDSIWAALGGADMTKATGTVTPIRNGEKKAMVKLDIGDLVITRKWTESGSTINVENQDGAKYPSPQAMLDKLIGKIAIDPLSFAAMDEKKQRDCLIKTADIKLDFDGSAQLRKGYFEKRTEVNRVIKMLESQLVAIPEYPEDTPDEEIPPQTIIDKMAASQKIIDNNNLIRGKLPEIDRNIATYTAKISELEAELKALQERIEAGKAILQRELKLRDIAKLDAEGLVDPDMLAFKDQLENVEITNKHVRNKKASAEILARIEPLRKSVESLESKMSQIDNEKIEALKAAKFPIPELSISDDGVTYKGVPFKQCSSAERLRVSIAIAMAMSPKLRVIRIVDGSLIDSKNMAIIESMCKEKDYQCWIEKVDESGKIGIYIEDGEIVTSEYVTA